MMYPQYRNVRCGKYLISSLKSSMTRQMLVTGLEEGLRRHYISKRQNAPYNCYKTRQKKDILIF